MCTRDCATLSVHSIMTATGIGVRTDYRRAGHEKASFTRETYAHTFDKAKHADELRDRFEKGYGHLLGDVNTVSNEDGNQPQPEPSNDASIAASVG